MPTPEEVGAALAAHRRVDLPALPGRTNHLESGVLLPVVWSPEPTVIATLRAAHLRHHPGEVCFPGGRPDPGDADIAATALREAREELGIHEARILGKLSSIPVYTSDHRLYPFVAEVPARPLVINEDEVAAVLRLDLGDIIGAERIEGIPWSHGDVHALSPFFCVEGHVMFGATAHALYELLLVAAPLFGRELPPLVPGKLGWADVLKDLG